MPELYAAADVTVLPTFYDPSSKVVIESLMLGIPAITTRYNGAAAFVLPEDGPPRGRVIEDPADDAALAAAMIELRDPAVHAACVAATAGLDQALSMKRHVDQLEQVLQRVVSGDDVRSA
jgi:glycosyltransferase involved in cell wall biosynthesis